MLCKFLISIYRVWNAVWRNYRIYWCPQTAERARTAPSLPCSLVLVWHTNIWGNNLVYSFSLSVMWLLQENADLGWAFMMVVMVWPCSACIYWMHFSVSELGCRKKKWQDLKGRAEKDLSPSQPLAGPKDLLSLVWPVYPSVLQEALPHASMWGLCSGLLQLPLALSDPLSLMLPIAASNVAFLSRRFYLPIPCFWKASRTIMDKIICWKGICSFGKGTENTKEWETTSETHYNKCCIQLCCHIITTPHSLHQSRKSIDLITSAMG